MQGSSLRASLVLIILALMAVGGFACGSNTPLPTYTPAATYTPLAPLPTHTPAATYTPLAPLPTHTPAATYTPLAPLPTHTPAATYTPLAPLPTHTPLPTNTPTPTPSVNISHPISAGASHTCALRENGDAVCWGGNSDGQANPPGGRFVAISAGWGHTCALRENGDAVCWGNNEYGQSDTGGRRFAAVSAGGDNWHPGRNQRHQRLEHTCALRENGDAVCWGNNQLGQLYYPDGRFVAISAGGSHTCALRENGDAVCWGNNEYGQSLNVTGQYFVAISAGVNHTCALRENGTGLCWGGSGSSPDQVKTLPLDGPFTAISAGREYTCALRENGDAVCWGSNSHGQLNAPYGIGFTAISAGWYHTCALRENGDAVCWGDNGSGRARPPRGRFAQPVSNSISRALPSGSPYDSFDAASILARFSTADAFEGERRAAAAGEIITRYESGMADTERILDLLHTLLPERSIGHRETIAFALTEHAADANTLSVPDLLAAIINDTTNDQTRLFAAMDMTLLYESGGLDSELALGLMDIIAPDLSINQRRQAAMALARLAADDDWNGEDKMAAASEVFRLATGVPLNTQQRIDAAIDSAGVAVRVFDTGGNFEDRDIDQATEIIKQALRGNLTTESIRSILGLGNSGQ